MILSLAAVWAIYWLGAKLFDRRVGLLSAALLSFNAYHIRYAQEARSYSLFVLLAILSSGFFVAALRQQSRRSQIGYLVTSVLAVYAHLYALLLFAGQRLSTRAWINPGADKERCGRILRRTWIWMAILCSPIVIFAAKTGAGPIRWIPKPTLHDLLRFAEQLAGNDGISLPLIYASMCLIAFVALRGRHAKHGAPILAFESWRLRFLLLWFFFPILLVLLLSLARPLFLGRYFIFCLPPFIILAAAGIVRLRRTWLIVAVVAAITLLSLQGTFSYYNHDFDLVRDGSETATNYVLDHAQPRDAMLFHIAEARVPYEFFKSIRDSKNFAAGPDIVYPRHGDHLDYRDFSGKPSMDLMKSLAAGYPRVWVVLMSNQTAGRPDVTTVMMKQVLDESFVEIEEEQFPEVEVRLYSRR